jgi:hypothetical protein
MKHYLNKCSANWADECDVHFLELIDENTYNRYEICKKVLKNWYSSYYFGTNEGWEDDFDYLDFTPIELSDSEYRVFKKFNIEGETVTDYFFEELQDALEEEGIISEDTDIFEMSEEDFKKAVESYESLLDE